MYSTRIRGVCCGKLDGHIGTWRVDCEADVPFLIFFFLSIFWTAVVFVGMFVDELFKIVGIYCISTVHCVSAFGGLVEDDGGVLLDERRGL